jgi:hypothetical protein
METGCSRPGKIVAPGAHQEGKERNQLLSPEEVTALLQGLKEGNGQFQAGASSLLPPRFPGLKEAWVWRWPVFKLQRLSRWLTGFTELRWPQF